MKAYKYLPCRSRKPISTGVFTADNFFRRFSGLIFRKRLKGDEILLLKGCKSIHTMGMRYSIDAVFMDSDGKIVAVFKDLKPWRFTPYFPDAVSVMETRSGFLGKWSLDVGDRIIFE